MYEVQKHFLLKSTKPNSKEQDYWYQFMRKLHPIS